MGPGELPVSDLFLLRVPMPSPHKQAPEERRVQREEEKKKRSQQVDLDYINGYTLLRLMNIGEQVLVIY